MTIKLKLTKSVAPIKLANTNFAYVASPASIPVLSTTGVTLSQYSNTQAMLGNVATAYTNAISYVNANYVNASSLQMSSLTDVDASVTSNNATLVYNTDSNKYVVKQLGLDGGDF